jgi:peptidylprolyl isomerase/peptidyl-prolyl cis-trans isomerase D
MGLEPKVLGTVDAIPANKVSAPIVGNQGVYLVQVSTKREGPAMTNIEMVRRSVSEKMLYGDPGQIRSALSEALKEKLKFKDKRAQSY